MPKTHGRTILCASVLAAISAQAQDNTLILEEVIVTAQKRVETLTDTPITVNVVTSDQIAQFGNFTINDINNMTTGLSISGNNTDFDFALRGIGADLNAPTIPRVSFYVDGSFFSQPRGLLTGLFDIAQIEVLRGPQGSLYGQTSPSGAITIRSRNPNLQEVDGYIRQTFNDKRGSNTQLAVSIPVIEDQLAIRVSGLYDTNENSDIENITLDRDLEYETTAYRVVALWEPMDSFDLRLSYLDIDDENDIDPMVEGNGLEVNDRKAVADYASFYRNETEMTALEMNYRFASELEATLAISDQSNVIPRDYDEDASPAQGGIVDIISSVDDVQTYELRLAYQDGDFWNWTIGAFYTESDSVTDVFADTFTAVSPGITAFTQVTSPAILSSNQWAVFTHNTLYLSENGTLTLGLRYSDYERESAQPFLIETTAFLPGGVEFPLPPVETEGISAEEQYGEDSEVTGTIKYQYRFSGAFMAYASYDRGWVPGAVNISATPLPPEFGAFDANTTDNIEVGFKWQVLDGRGLWNLAFYYQTYTDFMYNAEQFEVRGPAGDVDVASAVVNVDEAESYGFDTDFTVLLAENWTLRMGLSYNEAELSDAGNVPCTTGAELPEDIFAFYTCDFTGERAGAEPEWSANLSSEYSSAFGNNMEWYVRGLFNAESDYYSISERKDLDSYAMLDAYLGLRSANGTWDVNIWVKNVTDESAVLKTETRQDIPDLTVGTMVDNPYTWIRRSLDPRTAGITLSYNF